VDLEHGVFKAARQEFVMMRDIRVNFYEITGTKA
jgi:hypothetical protein